MKRASPAGKTTDAVARHVRGAISVSTGTAQVSATSTAEPSPLTRKRTRSSAASGSTTTALVSAGGTPISERSGVPSNGSKGPWRKPRDAKTFAAQANEVATMILNGEIDLDVARTYSGVARTMAQVLSAEVYRARFLQQEPNLSLEEE